MEGPTSSGGANGRPGASEASGRRSIPPVRSSSIVMYLDLASTGGRGERALTDSAVAEGQGRAGTSVVETEPSSSRTLFSSARAPRVHSEGRAPQTRPDRERIPDPRVGRDQPGARAAPKIV